MDPPEAKLYSYEEYLAIEAESDEKLEFADGDVWSMAGGTPAHADLAGAVYYHLRLALGGRPCKPFNSDLKIRVLARNRAYYPDVSVVCGPLERDRADENAVVNPTVLVEVLSPKTEAFDRGEKFDDYETLPSFREYVLVSTERVRVELFRREADGSWNLTHHGPGDTVRLASIDVTISVDALYAGVALDVRPKPRVVWHRFGRLRKR